MNKISGGAANQVTYTLAKGASQDLGSGYNLTVQDITATVAPCSVSGGACTLASAGTASPAKATTVTALNPATTPVVMLASQAGGVAQVISVGGPIVNDVTAAVMTAADFPEGTSVVKVVGSKIIVAGTHAADTTAAGNALINWMNTNLRA